MSKILVIEDDQICANIYRNKLLLDGFEVELANDGEAGLELLKHFQPDAILLDLILPKLPGVEVIKRVRAQPDFRQLPLIVFSNTYLTSVIQEAWKAGATKCLAKASCTPNQVIATITSLLTSGKPEKETAPVVESKQLVHIPERLVELYPADPDLEDVFLSLVSAEAA